MPSKISHDQRRAELGRYADEIRVLASRRRLFFHPRDPGRVWSWSRWRRRRQYQARLCHYRRRGYALT
jgi:hypothetical protein